MSVEIKKTFKSDSDALHFMDAVEENEQLRLKVQQLETKLVDIKNTTIYVVDKDLKTGVVCIEGEDFYNERFNDSAISKNGGVVLKLGDSVLKTSLYGESVQFRTTRLLDDFEEDK
jgi:hypothetical protein